MLIEIIDTTPMDVIAAIYQACLLSVESDMPLALAENQANDVFDFEHR